MNNLAAVLWCTCTIILLTGDVGMCDPIPPSTHDLDSDLEEISLLQKESNHPKQSSNVPYGIADLQTAMKDQKFQSYFEETLEKERNKQDTVKLQDVEKPIHAYMAKSDTVPFSTPENAEIMQADTLSTITRFVGVGYNLLRGNPEGDYNHGGLDPGIEITRPIFEFSYDDGKTEHYNGENGLKEPDQVDFHQLSGCSQKRGTHLSAYSGERSYQKHLETNVEAQASFIGFEFGLSAGMESARQSTESKERVTVVDEEICEKGVVRYQLENRFNSKYRVHPNFQNAIKGITARGWSPWCYFPFLENWGTHVIVQAEVGSRKIFRSYLSYIESYKYLQEKKNGGISAGGEYKGFTGSISVDIETMNEQLDSSAYKAEREEKIEIGKDIPMPLELTLKSITEALSPEFWNDLPDGDTYESLRVAEKRVHFERALREYPSYLNLKPKTNPEILVPNAWPNGNYALQSTPSGCPSGWSEGRRHHDTEEDNMWSQNLPTRVRGIYEKNDLTQYYCVKGDSSYLDFGIEWPKGSYCIARKGSCPPSFREGSIRWDDEDSNNENSKFGVLPDGTYDRNTVIQYCCRNDERPEVVITLPRDQPFILYRYGGTCQTVAGMCVTDEYLRFDDEDSFNGDYCSGAHPDDDSCDNNHTLHYCYYHKI